MYGDQYSEDDDIKHKKLSIKKSLGGLDPEEEKKLEELRKRRAMQQALNGSTR